MFTVAQIPITILCFKLIAKRAIQIYWFMIFIFQIYIINLPLESIVAHFC